MALFDMVKGKSSAEGDLETTIAEVANQLAAARGVHATLTAEMAIEEHDLNVGVTEAKPLVDKLRTQLAAQQQIIDRLTQKHSKATAELRRLRERRAEEEETQRQLSIPPLAAKYIEESRAIEKKAAELGALIEAHDKTRAALVLALNDREATRALSRDAQRNRLTSCLPRHFVMFDYTNPAAKAAMGGNNGHTPSWLNLPMVQLGSHRPTLPEVEQATLDNLIQLFASQDEAEAASARRGMTGTAIALEVPPFGGKLWRLVTGLRGRAAAQRQAAAAGAAR